MFEGFQGNLNLASLMPRYCSLSRTSFCSISRLLTVIDYWSKASQNMSFVFYRTEKKNETRIGLSDDVIICAAILHIFVIQENSTKKVKDDKKKRHHMRRLYRIFFVIHENSTKKVKDDNGKMTRVLMYLMCNDLIYRVQCCVLFTKTLSKGKIGK